ncbi:hypothetical protein M758_3G083700 [Ceratodon purpureus]|nr:hypothetical protein M758_3G083700 [Ceratodon purpureus]
MAMASGAVPPTGVFVTASSSPEWYQHLERNGSCLKLYSLLLERNELIHELGPKGRTVLHKGVEHGYVELVKFILVNMFDDEGTCTCKEHGPDVPRLTREQLLRQTCEDGITAVHIAVVSGSPKMVLLLKWAIDKTELELKQKTLLRKGEVSRRENYKSIRTRSTSEIKGCEGGAENRVLGKDGVSKEQCSSTPTSTTLNVEKSQSESVKGLGSDLPVPDVKDDSIDGIYEEDMVRKVQAFYQPIDRLREVQEENDMIRKVYECIEEILQNPQSFGINPRDQKLFDELKDVCKNNVDFEFVPKLAHIFVHFVVNTQGEYIVQDIFHAIVRAFNECDVREKRETGSMVVTLFKILDPRGRTILHAALDNEYEPTFITNLFGWIVEEYFKMFPEVVRQCVNAKDGAGRTILHPICIRPCNHVIMLSWSKEGEGVARSWGRLFNWEEPISPPFSMELGKLKQWLYPDWDGDWEVHPIYLAVLFNKERLFDMLLKNCNYPMSLSFDGNPEDKLHLLGPLQIAAFLGRTRILEIILQDKTKINDIVDQGLGDNDVFHQERDDFYLPAIHCAALSAQVEAIQSILKFPMYDPIIQHKAVRNDGRHYGTREEYGEGSALHFLLQKTNFNHIVKKLEIVTLLHVRPNSSLYAPLKKEFSKLHFDEHVPKDFSANEISCINLLLQAGIDIWTPHCITNERPNPGPMANDQARRWWYDKVVTEVVTQKTSINNASNATSVIATLVATASFIGPLQPPLGWAGDGYVHTSFISVRVYLVCNILSFYFSIASILMAVLPAIPMPKESLYDELFRSQRCLKTAALLLLVSIICILISFTSASIAVVSSERHDKQLVGASTALGWVVCIAVLVIYIIRLLRMLFHRNDRFRRWFAKHMSF